MRPQRINRSQDGLEVMTTKSRSMRTSGFSADNAGFWLFLATGATPLAVAPKRKPPETLDALLAAVLPPGTRIVAWGESKGIPQRTLLRLRRGLVERPHMGTVTLLAHVLGVEPARVQAACEASRAAAGK